MSGQSLEELETEYEQRKDADGIDAGSAPMTEEGAGRTAEDEEAPGPEEPDLTGFALLREFTRAMKEKGEYILDLHPEKFLREGNGCLYVLVPLALAGLAFAVSNGDGAQIALNVCLLIGLIAIVIMTRTISPAKNKFLRFTRDGVEIANQKTFLSWKDIGSVEIKCPAHDTGHVLVYLRGQEHSSVTRSRDIVRIDPLHVIPADICRLIAKGCELFDGRSLSYMDTFPTNQLLDALADAEEYVDIRVQGTDLRIFFKDGRFIVRAQGVEEESFASLTEMLRNYKVGNKKLSRLLNRDQFKILDKR